MRGSTTFIPLFLAKLTIGSICCFAMMTISLHAETLRANSERASSTDAFAENTLETESIANEANLFTRATMCGGSNAVDNLHLKTRIIQGHAMSRPCCVSWEPGRVDCFVRGPSSTVLHKAVKKDDDYCKCSEWEDLGGKIVGDVECVSNAPRHIDLFAIGDRTSLYMKSRSPNGWSAWVKKCDLIIEAPSCVKRDSSKITCAVRGSRNGGYAISSFDGVWGSCTSIAGIKTSPIVCSAREPNSVECFAMGQNTGLYSIHLGNDGWGSWSHRNGMYSGARPSATWTSNRIDVFVLSRTGEVVQRTWNDEWLEPVNLGGLFNAAPECVLTPDDRILCLAVGYRSDLFKNVFDGMQWSGWIDLFGKYMPEAPSCVVSDRKTVSCYIRNVYHEIVELDFEV